MFKARTDRLPNVTDQSKALDPSKKIAVQIQDTYPMEQLFLQGIEEEMKISKLVFIHGTTGFLGLHLTLIPNITLL